MSQNKYGEKRRFSKWMDYGSVNGEGQSDPCPTCQGTGRIPRGRFQCIFSLSYYLVTKKSFLGSFLLLNSWQVRRTNLWRSFLAATKGWNLTTRQFHFDKKPIVQQFSLSGINKMCFIVLIFSNLCATWFNVPQETLCVYSSGALPPDLLTDPVFPLPTEYGYVRCGTTVIYGLFHSRYS